MWCVAVPGLAGACAQLGIGWTQGTWHLVSLPLCLLSALPELGAGDAESHLLCSSCPMPCAEGGTRDVEAFPEVVVDKPDWTCYEDGEGGKAEVQRLVLWPWNSTPTGRKYSLRGQPWV